VFFAGDDRLVEPFLKHERFMIGSDGIFFADGRIHPRQYGAATRILGPLVRERKLFSLETAVRKLSGLPAERFGLTDRGLVRAGAFADLVVFDPATVSDRATYDDPHHLSVGIEHVLVNGVPVLRDGRPVEIAGPRLPGRALRFKAV
jgi:N-acyl-D-amino-acid deacylase